MKINAMKIPVFKQNNVLCIVIQRYTRMHKMFIMYAKYKKVFSQKKVPANLEKDFCVQF